MPGRRRRKKSKKLEWGVGDRIVPGVVGALLATAVGSFIWFLVNFRWVMRQQVEHSTRTEFQFIPYWPVLVFAGVIALVGVVLGPDRMTDILSSLIQSDQDD